MENILNKLTCSYGAEIKDWSLEEQKQLLEMYYLICKNETQIFDLIYKYHGCDSWEDIFRDYDPQYLKDKTTGVKVAIEELSEEISDELPEEN